MRVKVSMNGLDWTDLSQYSSASNVCIKAFTTLFPRSIVEIEAERIQERAWLIKKYFGKVTINVKNLAAVPVSRVEIYRKIENETPVLMGEISSNELNNGSYIYYDKYLEEDKGYTYQVRTYDSAGLLCGKSNFYSI